MPLEPSSISGRELAWTGDLRGSTTLREWPALGGTVTCSPAVVFCNLPTQGGACCRSLEIAADLNTLAKASELLSPMIELKATRQATVYYKYLSKLSDGCEGDLDDSERETAALRCAREACI